MIAKSDYIPEKQDIIWLNFDPSVGREIQKRRPALVVSRREYALQTGFVAVCPYHSRPTSFGRKGLLVPVSSDKVDGAVNPFQLYTFDFRMRNAQKNNKNGHTMFSESRPTLPVHLWRYLNPTMHRQGRNFSI